METAAALATLRAVQVPLELLSFLQLTGPLWPKNAKVENCMAFDYVIVGCGTAGAVLANRLTENEETTVLCIEAGPNPDQNSLLPDLFPLQPKSSRDWNYKSTFDDYAAQGTDNFTTITAGKMLGGSSSLNHFIVNRGAPIDYDEWAEITGDDSWKYDNVLPYFIKSERVEDNEILEFNGEYHGTDDPVGMTRQLSNKTDRYFEAFEEVGYDIVPDLNGEINLGYASCLFTIAEGVRQSTAYAYLRPARKRKNLFVVKNTLATKILFKKKAACGVETQNKFGKKTIFRAKKEVIISAGVFNTPQLLMLSGIGPKEHLDSMNICVRADLPVGDNLQDHTISTTIFKMEKSIEIPTIPPLSILPFPLFTGLVSLDSSKTYADYQTLTALLPHDAPYIPLNCGATFANRKEICDRFYEDSVGRNTMYSLLYSSKPFSRGFVRLNSTDPTVAPLITTGYYTNKTDLINMGRYYRDFLKIQNSTYFKSVKAELVDLQLEACKKFKYGSQKFWQCYALNTASTVYHFTSTCPMGTVVDSKLRVYGFKRLRIVDASVMPKIPRGTPEPAVLMIAEKAADMIKKDLNSLKDNYRCCACA